MDNKVSNPKTEVEKSIDLNDENYLNCLLEAEKNISNNLSIALNEASNETLYQDLKNMFDEVQSMQRKLYELSFSLGWYTLEKSEPNKITQKYNELSGKLNELI